MAGYGKPTWFYQKDIENLILSRYNVSIKINSKDVMKKHKRDSWGSRLGIIMAVAGCSWFG